MNHSIPETSDIPINNEQPKTEKNRHSWVWIVLLIEILLVAAYFRFVGLDWDQSQHLHPDERFLTMVTSALNPPKDLAGYFNTDQSTLNPHNQGYTFYVYGDLPVFLVRYLSGWLDQVGYDQVYLVGRAVSAGLDLITILLIFLLADELFRNKRLALLAAAFDALAVLQIQLSHYYTVDIPANFFIFTAFYIAVRIQTAAAKPDGLNGLKAPPFWRLLAGDWKSVVPFVLFGCASGMALASKISAAPLVLILPVAAWVWWNQQAARTQRITWPVILRNLALGGFFCLLAFRIFQPYAFTGPGFLGISLNPKWLSNMADVQAQTNGDVDAPFALQWVRRSVTFAWENMVNWGFGVPLGLLAWSGFLWMAWRMIRGEWRKYLLLWGWTAGFFTWQSLQGNPSMRYQIPVYPTLAIIASWFIVQIWESKPAWPKVPLFLSGLRRFGRIPWQKVAAFAIGFGVLGATFAWAVAFTQIYLRPVTRVAATNWVYQNIPGPINLHIQAPDGSISNQPLSFPYNAVIQPGKPYTAIFATPSTGAITDFSLTKLDISQFNSGLTQLDLQISDVDGGNQILGSGSLNLTASTTSDHTYVISLGDAVPVKPGRRYAVTLAVSNGNSAVTLSAPIQYSLLGNFHEQSETFPGQVLQPGKMIEVPITSQTGGQLGMVRVPVATTEMTPPYNLTMSLAVFDRTSINNVIGSATFKIENGTQLSALTFTFDPPVPLDAQHQYSIDITKLAGDTSPLLPGSLQLRTQGALSTQILPYPVQLIASGQPYLAMFNANYSGSLGEVHFPYISDEDPASSGQDTVVVSLVDGHNANTVLAMGQLSQDLRPAKDPRGYDVTVKFDQPVQVVEGEPYFIRVELANDGILALRGSSPANESTWDDGLPLRMNGYDGFSGLYQQNLNFEMYWDDNAEKLKRFEDTLNQADYIFITSNRQWGSITRVQERYPLSTAYYRDLLGCPAQQSIIWCYSVATPGMFNGALGFDLVKTFQSDPSLGQIQINDQFAEEAFTVYDHPKVLIFKKSADYSGQNVSALLSKVDYSMTLHVTPKKAPSYQANLMLPDNQLAQQQEGGTWSDLFNRALIFNQYPVLSLVLWYLAIMLLGWVVYPFVRLAFGRLADHGYPLARVAGMVILAYMVWMAGSNGIPFTQTSITVAFGILIVINAAIAYWQRVELKAEWKENRRYFITIELITLAFFTLDLLIRLGNPDLWHPAKGGEKPMDFSYLNAVLKSTSFPPYDPWFSGGFINYYYYGFVLIGTIIKGLGIVPSVAYNLVLPSLFSMVAMGAFSIGWNLFGGEKKRELDEGQDPDQPPVEDPAVAEGARLWGLERKPLLAGLSASVALLILGNLGTVKMIWEGFQRIIVSQDVMNQANIFSRMAWTIQGFIKYLGGATMPYGMGEWYWNPSRAIPGESITEFPFFTFLYGDPHAHLIALPVTLLALAWALSILKGRWQWGNGGKAWDIVARFGASFLLGGLAIGALRPTNTWDMPAYLGLGVLAVLYSAIRYGQIPDQILPFLHITWKRIMVGGASAALLVGLAFFLYQPFANWYAQGYNAFDLFDGDRTPLWAYTMHWGVFLFIIASWFVIETLDWMAKTPVSALSRFLPIRFGIAAFGLAFVALAVVVSLSVPVAWLIMVMAVWAAILIFRPGQTDSKRAVLIMTGLALVLTFLVEVVVLRGAGRMNTVFKFYLQVWTLFSISAAAAVWWLLPAAASLWTVGWRKAWLTAASVLIIGAALFPIFGGADKIRDRMSSTTPLTLDGLTYMATSTYSDQGKTMDLAQDYRAILWMQQNVKGSPVIVEANTSTYRWGTRFTIYTGLPGVLGWDYHETQQRAVVTSDWVEQRVTAIKDFYTTKDLISAQHFLDIYNVKYIIVGQLEQAYYPGDGLAKFSSQNGKMWREVYRDLDTAIYEVIK
ncbi:MAG TPA: DUF2298 domain-containing protein [Anaerolineaceae bacterium]